MKLNDIRVWVDGNTMQTTFTAHMIQNILDNLEDISKEDCLVRWVMWDQECSVYEAGEIIKCHSEMCINFEKFRLK